tara:strand:+ start:2571 stop:2993 length:423 start_codon:yes stop_codon:yes gene_type:complete
MWAVSFPQLFLALLIGSSTAIGADIEKGLHPVDFRLMQACEMFLVSVEDETVSAQDRCIKIVAASYRLRSNVTRCSVMYGVEWKPQWKRLGPHLIGIYDAAFRVLIEEPQSDLRGAALERLGTDMDLMGLAKYLSASSGR